MIHPTRTRKPSIIIDRRNVKHCVNNQLVNVTLGVEYAYDETRVQEDYNGPITNLDDISGLRIAPKYVVMQYGYVKDGSPQSKTLEKYPPEEAYDIDIMYDPEKGYPTKPCGA